MNDPRAEWEFRRLWRMRFSGLFLIAAICLVVMPIFLPADNTIIIPFLAIVLGTLFVTLILAITFWRLERAAWKRIA